MAVLQVTIKQLVLLWSPQNISTIGWGNGSKHSGLSIRGSSLLYGDYVWGVSLISQSHFHKLRAK